MLLTRSENIALTITITHLTLSLSMPAIASTSGRLHSEFIRILFLQAHRETDRFFPASGVQSAQSNMGVFFHFRRTVFSSMLKSRVSSILAKAAALRINLNLDGAPITSKSHTHPSQHHCGVSGVLVPKALVKLFIMNR